MGHSRTGEVAYLQLSIFTIFYRFQSVTRAYYRGAHGVILMYDVTSEDSFVAVKSWINSIRVYYYLMRTDYICIVTG